MAVTAFKLFRVRKNGTLGSLFIDTKRVIPVGEWLSCQRNHRKKGYMYRPYWHALEYPYAPHLSMRGRAWYVVSLCRVRSVKRPARYGGIWYLAEDMKVIGKALR